LTVSSAKTPTRSAELAKVRRRWKAKGWDWKSWVKTDADRAAALDGCWPDEGAYRHVVEFFYKWLRHSKGEWAGKPFTLMDWEDRDVIRPLFGWKRTDGTRRFRRCGIWVAKKNGKSTLCAGLGLYLTTADGEPGAEVYAAAVDRIQASIVFNEAKLMRDASPALRKRLKAITMTKTMTDERGCIYRALSKEAGAQEGLNIHALVFDELHAQKNRDLWDTLTYGGSARREPLYVSISTAGYDRESIGYEQYVYACQVRDGIIEDWTFLPVIYEADVGDDWTAERTWKKANPGWGETINIDAFRDDFREAQNSPSKENAFRRYRLNQWTEQETRWLPMEKWDTCGTTLDVDSLEGRACYAGLDLATTTDLTCLSLVFPPESDSGGGTDVVPFFWIPEENARERERRDRVPYSQWARQGLITMTPGNVTDYDRVRADIVALGEMYGIQEIAFDPWNATQLATQLGEEDGFMMIAHRQGFVSMNEPSKQFERLVTNGELNHGNNPILRWQASNVSVKTDPAGNIKPVKPQHKSALRIDGIVATIMGIGRAMVRVDDTSVYEERGVLVV
jgi:phage terminase large subunit-like protein